MKLKIKKLHPDAVIPSYAKPGDAGLDLVATTGGHIHYSMVEYGTGIAVEIPAGYVGLIVPRSSISEHGMTLANSVGIIDSGYRGEIKVRFRFRYMLSKKEPYAVGDRIAQLVIVPCPPVVIEEVDELSKTERGSGGFGSTGV